MPDTLNFRGTDFQIVYVDNSLSTGLNNGASLANAFQTFPSVTALSGNSIYLIRRTEYIDITRGTCTADNVMVIGMPTSGQLFFKGLPVAVKTAWGADAISGTNIYLSGVLNTPLRFGTSNTNGGYGLLNLKMFGPINQPQSNALVYIHGAGAIVDNCMVNVSGADISGNPALTALVPFSGIGFDTAEALIFNNNDTICYGATNDSIAVISNTTAATWIKEVGGNNTHTNASFNNSKFRSVHTGSSTTLRVNGLVGNGNFYASDFTNLTFFNVKGNPANGAYTHLYLDGILNGCIFRNITMSTSTASSNNNTGSHALRITNGGPGSSYGDQFLYTSKHIFENISITDQSSGAGIFIGIGFGNKFEDCVFRNISITSPRASNTNGSYNGFSLGNFCHHNTFENLYINHGADLIDTPINDTDIYGFVMGNTTYDGASKNIMTNSTIMCSRYAIGCTALDMSGCSITGALLVSGDMIDIDRLSVPPNMGKFTTFPPIINMRTDHSGGSNFIPSNNVLRVKQFVNNSIVSPSINYAYGLVAVESASGGVAIPITTPPSNSYAGALYMNNYPQVGYWSAFNYWHKLETSAVQYVTTDAISSGFSIRAICQNSPTTTYPIQAQAIVISPSPYRGDTLVTSGSVGNECTCTLYVATKFATLVTPKDIWFEIEIPDGPTGTNTRMISTYGRRNCVELDTTTSWVGEGSLLKYKIVLPFVLDRVENIYTRIYWNKTMVTAGAAIGYFSPKIIFRTN